MLTPVVWIPALVCLGLFLTLWGGMSFAYDRGRRHEREELAADRAARAIRRLPRVPAHVPPGRERHPVYRAVRPGSRYYERLGLSPAADPEWLEHERQALEMANTRPDPHPSGLLPAWSGPRGHFGPLDELTDSAFTREMAAEVDRGMAEVERILSGEQP